MKTQREFFDLVDALDFQVVLQVKGLNSKMTAVPYEKRWVVEWEITDTDDAFPEVA